MFIEKLRTALQDVEGSRRLFGFRLIGSEKPIEGWVVKESVDKDSFILDTCTVPGKEQLMTVSMAAVAAFAV